LALPLTNSATSMAVTTVAGWPTSFPFTAIIGEDTNKEEIVTVTNVAGTTLTITRGVGGTTGQAHDTGETIRHGVYAQDFEDASAHFASTTGVHGITGTIADTSSAQTLTNKTISGSSNTLSSIPQNAITGLTGDIVGTTATQTLTNKTLTSPAINGGTTNPTTLQQGGVQAVTVSDTQTLTNKTITGGVVNPTTLQQGGVQAATTSGIQTLTNKTISGSNNTLSAIPQSAIVGVSGTLVSTDATQTLTNKTISGASNTLSAIPASAVAETAWTSYTPTWTGSTTNPSLGNGTLSAAYIQIGKTVHFRINLTMGTTTTYGSGIWRFTLPVASNGAISGAGGVIGGGSIFDAAPTATRYYAFIYHYGSGVIALANDSFTGGNTQSLPMTFAVNDAISMTGTYEAV
jgi:hypothetical protein